MHLVQGKHQAFDVFGAMGASDIWCIWCISALFVHYQFALLGLSQGYTIFGSLAIRVDSNRIAKEPSSVSVGTISWNRIFGRFQEGGTEFSVGSKSWNRNPIERSV